MTTTAATSGTSTSGSSILTTLGTGSGIDTGALVTSLTAATYDPIDKALATKESANSAQISSLGTLSSGIDSFSSALATLIQGGTLMTQPTSSDSGVLTAAAKPGARLGDLSAQLVVKQLAQAQSLVSARFAASSSVVGAGGLTLTTAKGSFAIGLDASNDTLGGIAGAINASGSGVTASIVTDAGGARLALKGGTGAANAFTIAPAAGSDAALGALAYPPSGGAGLAQVQAAQDAIVAQDGVDVARATNRIDDLVDGVTLTLVKAAPGQTVSLGATRPTAAITQAVGDFVSAYNELHTSLAGATAAGGAFARNGSVRQMQTQLARLTSTVLNTSGGPATLAEIGVSTGRDGSLSLNSATLSKMLATYPDGVEALFNPSQRASSPLIKITSAVGSTKAGTYALANIVAAPPGASSGTIAGVAGIPTDTTLAASITSPAAGLAIEPQGDVASATVTVDAGLGGALKAVRDGLRASGGLLDTIGDTLTATKTKLADKRTKMESDETAYKDRLTSQFTAMDSKVAAFKATQSYLTQQVALWTKSN